MAMYLINKHTQNGWEQEYIFESSDEDAMMRGRNCLNETCNMVAIYRHKDYDSCGIKKFIASYDK